MRAVVAHEGRLTVEEVPAPEPGRGQVLLDVERCGICGSDLHALADSDPAADAAAEVGYRHLMRGGHRVVMGHEFVGTVAGYGPGCRAAWAAGTRLVAMPILQQPDGVHLTGLTERAPGAYAEQVLVSEALAMEVPADLDVDRAATTEPMAIALHAVRRGDVGARDTAVVVGCGPIGLAVVLVLKAMGVRTVVASDPAPGRRALAEACGADVVVDPTDGSPWEVFEDSRYLTSATDLFDLAVGTMDRLRRVPLLPWHRVVELAEKVGAGPRGPVVFECVGVPGVLEQVVSGTPLLSRVVVVGVCMQPDTFRPVIAINKELDVRFAFGYGPAEFHRTLQMIATGRLDPTPVLTGTVGLDGVAAAFEVLGTPDRHAKVLVDPAASADDL